MGILTNIVAADEDEIEAIGESLHPVSEWSGIEMRDVDTAKIASLHGLLTGEPFDEAMARCEPLYVSADEGALVLRLADELAQKLAAFDEEALGAVAVELAATEEFEDAGWGDEGIAAMLFDLADVARVAESQGQALFVWMHPLRT